MGLGEAFGVKTVKLNLSRDYDLQALFDAIRDVDFEAGHPQIVSHAGNKFIAFPELDRNNQVWISGKGSKWSVFRSPQVAGLEKVAENIVLEQVTAGITGLSAAFGNKKKLCIELVQKTADQINAMNL